MRTPFRSRTSLRSRSFAMKLSTAFALVNTIQSNVTRGRARRFERTAVVRRRDPDHRGGDRFGPARLEHLDQVFSLLARAGHDDAAAEQRTVVEPAQMFAQVRQPRRRPSAPALRRSLARRSSPSGADDGPLRGGRRAIHERARLFRRAAVRDEGIGDRRRSAAVRRSTRSSPEPGEPSPVHVWRRVGFSLVPAHEGSRRPRRRDT